MSDNNTNNKNNTVDDEAPLRVMSTDGDGAAAAVGAAAVDIPPIPAGAVGGSGAAAALPSAVPTYNGNDGDDDDVAMPAPGGGAAAAAATQNGNGGEGAQDDAASARQRRRKERRRQARAAAAAAGAAPPDNNDKDDDSGSDASSLYPSSSSADSMDDLNDVIGPFGILRGSYLPMRGRQRPATRHKPFKCACCNSGCSREDFEKKLQERVFSRREIKDELGVLAWSIDDLPAEINFPRINHAVLRQIVLFLGSSLNDLLALRLASRTLCVLVDRHPAFRWHLPQRHEVLPIVIALRLDRPPVLRKRWFEDPTRPGERHYVYEIDSKALREVNLNDETDAQRCLKDWLACVCCCKEAPRDGTLFFDDDEIDNLTRERMQAFRGVNSTPEFARALLTEEERTLAKAAIIAPGAVGGAVDWVRRLRDTAGGAAAAAPGAAAVVNPIEHQTSDHSEPLNNGDDSASSSSSTKSNQSTTKQIGHVIIEAVALDGSNDDATAAGMGARQHTADASKPIVGEVRAVMYSDMLVNIDDGRAKRRRLRKLERAEKAAVANNVLLASSVEATSSLRKNRTQAATREEHAAAKAEAKADVMSVADARRFLATHDEFGYQLDDQRQRIVMRPVKRRHLEAVGALPRSSAAPAASSGAAPAAAAATADADAKNRYILMPFPRGIVPEQEELSPVHRYVRVNRHLDKKILDRLCAGTTNRREYQFVSCSAYVSAVRSVAAKVHNETRVSYMSTRFDIVPLLLQFAALVVLVLGMAFLLGYYVRNTVIAPSDAGLSVAIGLITTTLFLVFGLCPPCGIYFRNRQTFDDYMTRSTMQRALMFYFLSIMLVLLAIPLALVAARVGEAEFLLFEQGTLSVCEAFGGLSAASTMASTAAACSSLPASAQPTKLAESTTFLRFEPGTQILFHPPLSSYNFSLVRASSLPAGTNLRNITQPIVPFSVQQTGTGCAVVANARAPIPATGSGIGGITRGFPAYYTIIAPASSSPACGARRNFTVLIAGPRAGCPFWTSRPPGSFDELERISSADDNAVHPRFGGLLANTTAAEAFLVANTTLGDEYLDRAMRIWSDQTSATTARRCAASSFLVNVTKPAGAAAPDFVLRVSQRYGPHWTSFFRATGYDSDRDDEVSWSSGSAEFRLGGVPLLMADQSMFAAHRPTAALSNTMITNPFLGDGDGLGVSGVWSGATPAGLLAMRDDYRSGVFGIVIFAAAAMVIAGYLSTFSRTWSRQHYSVVVSVLFFAVFATPIVEVILTSICYARSTRLDSDELLNPTFCLQASERDIEGSFITIMIFGGAQGVLALMVICLFILMARARRGDDDWDD